MVATHKVNAVTLRAAIHDGTHNATRLWSLGEEISNQDDARPGKPTIHQQQQLLKLCPASVNIANGNSGVLGRAGVRPAPELLPVLGVSMAVV